MNSQRLYIVTGSSKGLGLEICKELIKSDCIVLGISRSKSKIDNSKYFHFEHDFKNKINITDIINLKINLNTKIYVIINASQRFDNEYNSNNFYNMLLASISVNFHNQIDFLNKINQENKIEKLFFISSYTIFTSGNNAKDLGYYLSKENFYRMTLLIKKHYKINCKCFIVGSIKTQQLNNQPSIISNIPFFGSFIEKKISLTPEIVAKKIINNLDKNNNIILIPNIPIFLVKIVVKIIEIISFKKNIQ